MSKTTPAEKRPTATEQRLSPAEIQDAEDQRDRLKMRLENAKDALQKREGELARVINAEQNAQRILTMTKDQEGFATERARANEMLAHCALRRRELEPVVANRRDMVAAIETQLRKIPSFAIQARRDIEKLAMELASPLP